MKKLTAGIFATLLAVVSADSAYAAIASSGYVDDKVGEVQTAVTAQIATKADKATTLSGYGITDAYTSAQGTALAGRVSAVEAPKAQVAANVTGPVSGGTVYTAIQNVSGDVSGVTSDVGTLKTDMAQAKEDISALEEASATHATQTQLSSGLAGKQDKNMGSSAANSIVTTDGTGNITASATIAASKVSGLANVATSGAYSDLSGRPTIPTVDAAITEDSTNAVQSGAVYDALATKANSADIPTTVAELTDADNYALVSTMNTELGKKQNSLTETQLNAVNSGITTTKVATYDGYAEKISANTSAIGTKADADDVTALTGRVAAVEAPKATVATGQTGPVSGQTVFDAIQDVTGNVSGVTGRVDTLEDEMDTAQADISGLKTDLADKQDKLTQTGSANQPVYVDATGKVTAGNTIPTVTTSITTGQTGAAQAGAVATALAAKANSADVYTKSAADDAFIPRPSANCTATGAKCVLVTNGTGFEWEVIERGDAE